MNKEQKNELRSELFRHLDGITICPTAYLLHEYDVLAYISQKQKTSLSELSEVFKANEGYLNVALHAVASQGWLDYQVEKADIFVATNENSTLAFELIPLFKEVVQLIHYSERFHRRKFQEKPFLFLEKIFKKYINRYDLPLPKTENEATIQNQILKHIEGIIVGPTVVALGMNGMFHKYFMEASFRPEEFHGDAESFGRLLDIFVSLGWFVKSNKTYSFTEKGLFFAKRSSAYGVTVSYIPAFRKLKDLVFGDPNIFWNLPEGSKEIHVDREMNVWGSGGAHAAYFNKIDDIIIDIFNQPIENQPRGIVDMGCGNGAFLIHLFNLIEKRTLRGTQLEEYPLFLVGADYNRAALNVTRANIIQSEIWAKVIWGDIGRPDLLADNLREDYGINLSDLLNVRTFLDHNRIWKEPVSTNRVGQSTSSGAFAFRGRRLANDLVEANLKEHFMSWAPYVKKFGLLVIELHTISPTIIARNIGKTATTAYNTTHGFSDQYILELDIFRRVAMEAGLFPVEQHLSQFPNNELATVSINLFKA